VSLVRGRLPKARAGSCEPARLIGGYNTVTPARLALVILFAIVDMAIVLTLHGATPWTYVSDDQHCCRLPLISVLFLTDSSTELGDEYYLYSTPPPQSSKILSLSATLGSEGTTGITLAPLEL